MLVVALSVSGLNGYASALAACPMQEHGAAHVHSAADHDAMPGHAHGPETALLDGAQSVDTAAPAGDEPASSDGPCTHLHLHSCATFAVAAADCTLTMAAHARTTVPVGEAHILLGQISSPLFRPPRVVA